MHSSPPSATITILVKTQDVNNMFRADRAAHLSFLNCPDATALSPLLEMGTNAWQFAESKAAIKVRNILTRSSSILALDNTYRTVVLWLDSAFVLLKYVLLLLLSLFKEQFPIPTIPTLRIVT